MQNGCKREKWLWHEWEQYVCCEIKAQRKGKEGLKAAQVRHNRHNLIRIAWSRFSKICFLPRRGAYFCKTVMKKKMKNTKTGSKVHVRMQVMLSKAFQNGHFPLARRKILIFGQYKRKCSSQNDGFRSFRYGNVSLRTVFAKIVFRKCASYRRGEHNFMKNEKIK